MRQKDSTFMLNANIYVYKNIFVCFYDLTASDGLCGLLQNSTQRDRSHPKAIRALHSETKTHTGIYKMLFKLELNERT